MSEPTEYKLTPRQKRIFSDNKQQQRASGKSVQQSVNYIESVESLYKALIDDDKIKDKADLMLRLRSWLTKVSEFDPVTGQALHTGIIDLMDIVAHSVEDNQSKGEIKDRVYRIVSHIREAVLSIIKQPRDKIVREHAMVPIHAAREVDSKSVQWLSRQPGRTVRVKLAGKPYIKAVKRRSSVDTSENRLLKAFLHQLEQILIERQAALEEASEETCEEFLVSIQRWLRTDESSEIGAWDNLPPNNTLLQDRRYRKVWDGWQWLQSIDESIKEDNKRLNHDILRVLYWETLSLLNQTGRFRTIQQPVNLDYDNFSIVPALPIKGYLFPEDLDTEFSGKIDKLVTEKGFGFIEGYFFHASDLTDGLNFDELQEGEKLLFEVEDSPKGKCAKRLKKFKDKPKILELKLSDKLIEIIVGDETFLIQLDEDQISLTQKPKGSRKKFPLNLSVFQEIPQAIVSLYKETTFDRLTKVDSQNDLVQMDMSVVDLCSIRPGFTNDTGSLDFLPFRLLYQKWIIDGEERFVDCSHTKAITLRPDIETVSLRSLFLQNSKLSGASKSSASMFFAKKLRDYIQADRLTYLVPDWGNDFDLESIRKSVNFYFEDSTPLPKSIAAIFAWQSSKRFTQDKVRENDFVLVVDSFDGGISVTPVQAVYQDELNEILPETQGISWERHPPLIVESTNIHNDMIQNLSQDGCHKPEELIHLFGLDGLIKDAGEISFVSDVNWYHLPGSIREVLNKDLDTNIISNDTISDCLNLTNRDFQGIKVFILPLEDTIKKSELGRKIKWLNSDLSPIQGCQTLIEWQKGVADIALWRDHLPELSFRDIPLQITDKFFWWADFNLVKDISVIPKRGMPIDIRIENHFTLPANTKDPQDHYRFGLILGKGKKELQYDAYLKSPAFPLKKDTACRLKMTYTYGADDPYDLKFIPLDSAEAGFKSIRVEWRSASDCESADHKNLPVPDFPARKSWSDFQNFEERNGDSLIDWVEKDIEKVSDIFRFLEGEDSSRIYDDDVTNDWNWKEDRNGKQFCYLKYDGIGDVFFHESNFEIFNPEAEKISFDTEEQRDRDGYVARNVTLGKSISTRTVEHFRKSLRFPALTIWNHGHSLSEPDVPDHFRNAIFEGTQKSLSIIESENMPDTLKDELFFFLCCLHKDAPDYVANRLLASVKNHGKFVNYYRNFAFAIGYSELPWQQELLENVINLIDNDGLTRSIKLEILAIALWRSKELIYKLTEKELLALTQNLFSCLEFDLQKVINDGKGYQIAILSKHLELLLALLRARASKDERIKMLLAPHKKQTKKFVSLVDSISKMAMENDIELKSRINLQKIEKPEAFSNTPDLLYALRMYLTGDSGANTIVITGVTEEN